MVFQLRIPLNVIAQPMAVHKVVKHVLPLPFVLSVLWDIGCHRVNVRCIALLTIIGHLLKLAKAALLNAKPV